MRLITILLVAMIIFPTHINLKAPINNAEDWCYQLQNADPVAIAESGFDIVVMDYSRDGTDASAYTREEIDLLKNSGIIPIVYISIGEAEDYRFYWNDSWRNNPPEWLGNENPEWPGNYPVKYWYPEWKKIVFTYLDKIIEQGFMGVYLDKIDSFEYWSDPDNGEGFVISEEEAAVKMINFVVEIAEYVRNKTGNPNFLVIPQNGERILDYDYNGTYLDTISGIGVEDLWYNETEPNPENIVNERIQYLDTIKNAGKIVLSVDYVDDGTGYTGENKARIDDYISKARSKGYIPYAARTDRALDNLNIIPGIQPYQPMQSNDNSVIQDQKVWLATTFTIVILVILIAVRKLRSKSNLAKNYNIQKINK